MTSVSVNALVGKLNPSVHAALEQAAWSCRQMTHYDIELEHLFLKLVEDTEGDLPRILHHFDVNAGRVVNDITAATERLKRGNTRDTPGISPRIPDLFQAAWLHSSIDQSGTTIRSGNLLYALLSDSEFYSVAGELSRELKRIDTDELDKKFQAIRTRQEVPGDHAGFEGGDVGRARGR